MTSTKLVTYILQRHLLPGLDADLTGDSQDISGLALYYEFKDAG